MKSTIAILSLLLILACTTAKPVVTEVPIQYREKIVERLVPVQAPADSSLITAQFECDSLNKVILKSLSELKSKNVQSGFSFDKGLLSYDLKTSPSLSYAKVKDSIVYQEVAVKVPYPVITNELTWWQKLWVKMGKGAAVIGAILIGFFIVKSRIVQK